MAEAAAASLRYEVEDAVATMTLDRPEARNALDAALKRDAARGASRPRAPTAPCASSS